MKGRFTPFWYRFKNWFRTKPGPGEPLRFLCGSEEELRRVTTWMCHHYFPAPYNPYGNVRVSYYAEDVFGGVSVGSAWPISALEASFAGDGGQPLLQQCKAISNHAPSDNDGILLMMQGCLFISTKNVFTGTQWVKWVKIGLSLFPINRHPGLPSLFCIGQAPYCLTVIVQPPSAHERAEALLSLSEWLNGKVSEQNKRELLQLPDDVEG